jgi:hypothetical protein
MTRTILTTLATIILGLVLSASQTGCLLVAAAAGTGAGVAYVRGDLDTSLDADAKRVADATERAMKALEINVVSKQADGLDGKIIGRTARDVKMTVVIKAESEKVSKVSIRAGVFGDDAMQDRLLAKIKQELTSTANVE